MSFKLTGDTKKMFNKWRNEVEKRMRIKKAFIQPSIISQSQEECFEKISPIKGEMLTGGLINHSHPSNEGNIFVVDGEKQAKPVYLLTSGYYWAVCLGVIELPDGESFILVFDPYDENGWRHTEICLTVQKKIRSSEALGELLFAFGKYEGIHSDSSLVIDNVAAFRDMFEDKKVGIEVSENSETGLLYVTDFFNLVDTEEFPTCPEEIVRNVF
ncbi:MAG: hypothetical protein NC489_28885 [Ruminococcus flavefaciens]|nr:hypothetical protein [Ruminococcus flavefaciens]